MFIRKYKGNIPDRIALHADDINVGSYIVYLNEEGIACYDADGLSPIGADTLENLYVKGFFVSDSGEFYTPITMSRGEDLVSVSIIRYDAETEAMVYSAITSGDERIIIPSPYL